MERIDSTLADGQGAGGAESTAADAGEIAENNPRRATAPSRPLSVPACVLIGVAAAAIGLLPWLIAGMRLPLQNLWAAQTLPAQMPIVLLPFSQYALTLILALIVVGYAIAAVAARATRGRHPRRAVLAIALGVLTVQVVAVIQTTAVVLGGLQQRGASTLYVGALLAVVTFAIVVGLLILRLIATTPHAGAMIGLSIAAIVAGSWVSGLIAPLGSTPTDATGWLLSYVVRWIPAILVGAAIAWGGIGTPGRIVAAIGGLLLLWVGPAAFTAVSAAAGSRVLLPYPADLIDYALNVFRSALLLPELVLPPIIVAIVVATVGLIVRGLVSRLREGDVSGSEF